ncbi:MAG: acyl-CoA dehydrogenase [Patescibacteria group bacterium]
MSRTELEAVESGDVWFDRELFSGRPDFSVLDQLVLRDLTDEEQAFLRGPVERVCQMADEWTITTGNKDLPKEVWEYLKKEKFFGILVPKLYEGLGFSHNAFSIIVKKIMTRAFAAGSTMLIPNSLGAVGLIVEHGTPEQQAHYLPRLASGEEVPSFVMTGPFAGCDLERMPDTGQVEYGDYNGEKVLGIRLSWEKRYITLAPVATVLELAFQTMRDGENVGITCALVPTSHPGVVIGRRHWPARQNFMNGPTSGKDVFIPMSMVLGGEKMLGQGWRMTMEQLHAARAFSIPSLGTAAAQFVARNVGAYARLREQFKRPIGTFEGVQTKLASIAADAFMLECARKVSMAALDSGTVPAVISAILKYQSTERARTAVLDGMDILGGRGVFEGPRNFLFNIYQMIPIIITVEGANILTRSFITFGHGLMRCHRYLLDEFMGLSSNDHKRFGRAFIAHVRHVVVSLIRVLLLNVAALFWGRMAYRSHIRLTSARFALLTEVLLAVYGGTIKRRERISGAMADILSEMYLMSCVLRSADPGDPDVQTLVQWIHMRGRVVIQQRFTDVLQNLPSALLSVAVRLILFPFGRCAQQPNSEMDKRVARLIMNAGPIRDLITDGIYVSTDPGDKTGCLEAGLQYILRNEPLPTELLRRIIDVDDFDKQELAEL